MFEYYSNCARTQSGIRMCVCVTFVDSVCGTYAMTFRLAFWTAAL